MDDKKKQGAGNRECELVERLQSGDFRAFDEIFELLRGKLLAFASRMTGDPRQAEDIVQESFIVLAQEIQSIRPEKGVSSWLFRVARNKSIDFIRRRKREFVPGDDFINAGKTGAVTAPEAGPDQRLISSETRSRTAALLDRLAPEERELVVLRYYGGLTLAEISRVVRRPVTTVLWRLKRSLAGMRKAENEMR